MAFAINVDIELDTDILTYTGEFLKQLDKFVEDFEDGAIAQIVDSSVNQFVKEEEEREEGEEEEETEEEEEEEEDQEEDEDEEEDNDETETS